MSDGLKTAPYGFWTGSFDIKALFERPPTPMYPVRHQDRTYWLEARAGEGGRVVLMQRDHAGDERALTPAGFSIRSRVHEYGGCPYTIAGHACYFVNDEDQRIYAQNIIDGSDPAPVTPPPAPDIQQRYVDLSVTADGRYLVCVMEKAFPSAEHDNMLAAIELESGVIQEPTILHSGHDFYANPVPDPAGGRIAWFQWDHPDMPWDRSEAMIAACAAGPAGLRLQEVERVVGGGDTSVCQLSFDDNGDLLLAIDGDGAPGTVPNFWNLYRWDGGRFTQLTFDDKEYGAPHWVFGDRRYVILEDHILAVRTGAEGDELVIVDKHGGGIERVDTDATDIKQLSRAGPNEALMIAAARDRSPSLTEWRDRRMNPVKGVHELLPTEGVSRPQAIRFSTGDKATAHAYFYPPCNPHYGAPEGEAPPLLVMAHGGPTARCSNALDLTRQYWTGIGFAVLDVNYRGSTGYGRTYRRSLLGNWGQTDPEDIVNGIENVADRGWANRDLVFIRGRSAGGYAVLCVLTQYPTVFAAGACYYGIGNLLTLAQITHKFEARYTDRLIGEAYRPESAEAPGSRFHTRSPVHAVSAIRSPVIVFQGLDDKIVPPDVSREIVQALARQGVAHDYVEYAGEGHGFRSSKANIDALERETAFFRSVLSAARKESSRRTGVAGTEP